MEFYSTIDMRDLIPGSAYFRWFEALHLRRWDICIHPTVTIAQNIIKTAKMMDNVRGQLGSKPITVTSWLRTKEYNKEIGGASGSQHLLGLAVDFKHPLMNADEARIELLKNIDRWDIRMEDAPGSDWVHIDLKSPCDERYFKP